MESTSWWDRIARGARSLFWIAFLIMFLTQAYAPLRLEAARLDVLHRLEEAHKSRAIALIHRQESISLLGIPIARYIDIEDSEAILRVIRLTPDDQPIESSAPHARGSGARGRTDRPGARRAQG